MCVRERVRVLSVLVHNDNFSQSAAGESLHSLPFGSCLQSKGALR